ncbi:MAG: 3' terminal RNA ribose 2'-O-methyltransferase Hen1 [Planctomyces sp.]|nr:3' terminal RNA ribose 2'-O-methyltransferase Hen1 [Planctomyces sp.]
MLLSITTTHEPVTDLGFLLHKHPDRFQSFDLSFGRAHFFYPEVSESRCTASLLLDLNEIELVRDSHKSPQASLDNYVNDRPYVASSMMSVAISKVLRSAMQGTCKDRPELATTAIPLVAELSVLPVRGGEEFLRNVFEPLEYVVTARSHPVDDHFPEWGESRYYTVTLQHTISLAELLRHLYVLIPVFDNLKHYYISEQELDKLISKGEGWLTSHPLKEQITRRYLKNRTMLTRRELELLRDETEAPGEDQLEDRDGTELEIERPLSLNEQRHATVLSVLQASGAKRVLDLGCGEGKLLRDLMTVKEFEEIIGVDVSVRALENAVRRLNYERLPPHQRDRVKLLHGSLMYRDARVEGFDAAAVVEVIEHLDPPRLTAFESVLFRHTRPRTVVITTPNREYNIRWESLPAGAFRHADHRFEWTRTEFQSWATRVAAEYGYTVRYLPIGPEDPEVGSPTQMAIFERKANPDE